MPKTNAREHLLEARLAHHLGQINIPSQPFIGDRMWAESAEQPRRGRFSARMPTAAGHASGHGNFMYLHVTFMSRKPWRKWMLATCLRLPTRNKTCQSPAGQHPAWMHVVRGCRWPQLLRSYLKTYRLGPVSCDETCWDLLQSDSEKYYSPHNKWKRYCRLKSVFCGPHKSSCDTTETTVQLFEWRQPGGCGWQDLRTDTRWVPKRRDAWIDGTSFPRNHHRKTSGPFEILKQST